MLLDIWMIGNDRQTIIEDQRKINESGSMRAVCLLSEAVLEKNIANVLDPSSGMVFPSLIVLDYDIAKNDDFKIVNNIKKYDAFAGVPLIIAVEEKSNKVLEECYENGAILVVHKIFSKAELCQIENMAWQHENTRLFERNLQKQMGELQNAKEIFMLNKQLEARNSLLHRAFGRYFSEDIVDFILKNEENASLGGEKRKVAVMLTDLRNFTALSEDIDSEKLTSALNFYFTKMVDIVTRYRGTVIEFTGDGMLVVFGAPLHVESEVDNAVAAAIEMQNAMPLVNEHFTQTGFSLLEMGIGLHYGEVYIGNIGSDKIMRYNVIGNTVNECSRIESCSVGGQILASEEILANADSRIIAGSKMPVRAKGIKRIIYISQIDGIDGKFKVSRQDDHVDLNVMKEPEREVILHLHFIRGKIVSKDYITVRLIGYSDREMLVETKKDDADKLDIFTNVKICRKKDDNEDLFEGLYSKITGRKDLTWTLHYTDTKDTVDKFIDFANNGDS